MEVMVASQKITERTKMVKFDLQALKLSNKTRYIQVCIVCSFTTVKLSWHLLIMPLLSYDGNICNSQKFEVESADLTRPNAHIDSWYWICYQSYLPVASLQGLFCGRDPSAISPTDEETRTLGVKLKLLSGFKQAKITYCPDTPPVRDIITKVTIFNY